MKQLSGKKILYLILVLALLLSLLPASALASETYTDVELSFYDASNGFVFTTDNGSSLLNTYGAWKDLSLTVQRQGSSQSAESAFAAELEEVQARINLDESGKVHIYGASEKGSFKLVIPAGTIVTPGASAASSQKLRITNTVVLERKPAYWGTASGWLEQAEQLQEKSINLSFSQVDSNGRWTLGSSGNSLVSGWYRTDAIIDGVETQVMIEKTTWRLYIYSNTLRPDAVASVQTPANSFIIPQGAKMIPVTSFEQCSMVEGAQPYEVANHLQVIYVDGKWKVGENYSITALTYEQGEVTGQYTSVRSAVSNAQGTNQYVKLLADSDETIYVSKNLYLDLNGYNLKKAAVYRGATLCAMDTATDSYNSDLGYGTIGTITGSYATTHRTNVDGKYKRYVAISGNEGTSFHRFYIGITDMNVDSGSAGVGYTLTVAGDSKVLATLATEDSFGIQITAKDENGNLVPGFQRTLSGDVSQLQAGINTQKLLLSNVLTKDSHENAVRGKYIVCAEAYLNFSSETVKSSATERSVQQMFERLNENFESFTEEQKYAVKAMVIRCGIDKLDWNVETILNWNYVSPLYLIQNGRSNYRIVVSDSADDNEIMAAYELQRFIQKSTAVKLEIIKESKTETGGRYIYIGATNAANTVSVTPSYEQTLDNGFRMARIGNHLYLRGYSSIGTRNSVYEFLNRFFDYDYYGLDELYIAQKDNVTISVLDEVVTPSFDWRTANYGWGVWDEYTAARMQMNQATEFYINGWDCHYSYDIVSPVTYDYTSDQYKDWFASRVVGPDGGPYEPVQLCYSNEEMLETYIANLLKIIEKSDLPYIILGQEDHPWWCECDNCTALATQYGTDAAVMILFLNKVQAAVDEWFAENRPGEQPTMCLMFAYYDTAVPPANWNAQSGKWEPIDEAMIINSNSGIMFAPIDMESDVAFSDYDAADKNNPHGQLLGWKSCTENIFAWTYSQNFYEYFLPYNTFDTVQENYQLLLDNGCISILDQTQSNSKGYMTGWNMAKAYLLSNLQWDNSRNTETVLKDFFNQYYGDASFVMYSLFRDEMNWLNYVHSQLGAEGGIYEEILLAKYWPEDLLHSYLDQIDKAYAAIAPIAQTDPERYALLYTRIQAESLQFRYLLIQLYPNSYDAQTLYEEKIAFRAACDKLSITHYSQYNSVDELWKSWGIA